VFIILGTQGPAGRYRDVLLVLGPRWLQSKKSHRRVALTRRSYHDPWTGQEPHRVLPGAQKRGGLKERAGFSRAVKAFFLLPVLLYSFEAVSIRSVQMSKHPSTTRKRLLELDAVRAVAILMIVASHLSYYFHSNLFGWNNVLGTYLVLFGLGTFFFLSGFVLGYNNRKFNAWSDVASFFKKRLLRIYPLYLVALALAVGAFILLPSQSHFSLSSSQVLIYALGLQGLLAPRYVPDFYMFWFVGVILLCYLIYPLMMRYGSNNKVRLLLISAAIFALFLAMRLSFGIVDTRFFLYYFIFVSGIAASTFHTKLLLDKRRTFVGAALVLTALVTVHVAIYSHQLPSDPTYVFNAGQFGPYADISLFLVLNAMVLLFMPLLYYFASYLISLTKLVPTLLFISYASYAIFLFNPLILAGLNTIFTGMHLPVGFPRDMLLTIIGVSASCLFGYAFQRAADRTVQTLAR